MKKILIVSWQKDSHYAFALAYDLKGELIKIPVKNRFSYLLNFIKTLLILKKKKKDFLFLEIPPIYLIYLILFFKRKVMVVSHSNIFLLDNWWHRFQLSCLKFFLKKTKGLILHNEKLLELVKDCPVRKLVIEPPPRKLKTVVPKEEKSEKKKALIILSFSTDEPIAELIKSCEETKEIDFYFSGDYRKFSKTFFFPKVKNIFFTGYLSEEEYEKLLVTVDFIIGLTTRDYTCLQSGYDALGVEKPFLTSDKEVLKKYFFKGTIFVKNEKEDIKRGIREILEKYEILKKEIRELKLIKMEKWKKNIKALKEIIEDD
uniref:Glycosyltransferase n=1 Tax=candidate division WOR-3 bacterium TaxID=2052148 RepID=A0A7V3ZVT7_UNCW3